MHRLSRLAPIALAAAALLPAQALRFDSDWHHAPDRRWPGQHWYANRQQDWRIAGGMLECTNSRPDAPVRTVHLLTRRTTAAIDAPVRIVISIEPADAGAAREPGSAVGLLFGIGGESIDWRIGALVQHAPGPGGGVLAAVEADHRIVLRDFTAASGRRGGWSIGGRTELAALPALAEPVSLRESAVQVYPLRLELTLRPDGEDVDVLLHAQPRLGTPERLRAKLPRARCAGGIALVSHLGSRSGSAGFRIRQFLLSATPVSVAVRDERAFGPVLGVLHTLHEPAPGQHELALNAQLPPLGAGDVVAASLDLARQDGGWQTIAAAEREPDSFTLPFRVAAWDATRRTDVRVRIALRRRDGAADEHVYAATIPAVPRGRPVVLANLSCVKNFGGELEWTGRSLWFPHAEVVAALRVHAPDLLFFAGDQIYEGDLSGVDGRDDETLLLDYHTKWQRFLWAFGELTRAIPAVVIPDDHDVYHGNLWGAGGVRAAARDGLSAQDAGGYKLAPGIVNAVHRTQTGHLPPPSVPGPIGAGIQPFTTRLHWAGISFAVLADRMWKDAPSVAVPRGRCRNGFFHDEEFDPVDADVEGANLLGTAQEEFLAAWSTEPPAQTWARLVLSQSAFACLQTLPRAHARSDDPPQRVPPDDAPPLDDIPVADADSNGWPQSARNRALRLLAAAGAIHLCGDQHLGSVVRYGADRFGDSVLAFTSPAVANAWPRRWMPSAAPLRAEHGAPPYLGDYLDGFGNKVTVIAVANPRVSGREPAMLHDRASGYGIVRLDPDARTVTFEAWPRWSDPRERKQMFPGWPVTERLPALR